MTTVQKTDEGFRPYRYLAMRVLAQAFVDLENPARSSHRESARVFLAGSAMMIHWCRVASLEPLCIVSHAEKLMAKCIRADRDRLTSSWHETRQPSSKVDRSTA
jgi:hypothetical protein